MNRILNLPFLFLLAFLVSCDQNEPGRNDIIGKWEATTFMSVESMLYAKNNNYNPVIEFKTDGTYSIKLDFNQCMGNFSVYDNLNISINAAGCTKMCCDSRFSDKFVQMLPRVNSYVIEGNKLKMNISEWGWIELEPAN
jgi:heat shock protein HslJ